MRVINIRRRGKFFQSVSILAGGTLLSQVILFLATPILTRIYEPADFGILAVFTGVAAIGAIICSGRYEYAIGLPTKDSEGFALVKLILVLGGLISLLYLILLFFLKSIGKGTFNQNSFIQSPIIYFFPLHTFFTSVYGALVYWYQRKKLYKKISISVIVQAFVTIVVNLCFGLLGYENGLIFGLIAGVFGAIIYLKANIKFSVFGKFKTLFFQVQSAAKKHVSFPRYMIFSDLASTGSQQLLPILFSFYFGAATVGYFALSNRVIRIPSILLTSSIKDVFRNEAIDSYKSSGTAHELFKNTLRKLTFVAVPTFIGIAVTSPWFFTFFFGSNWKTAGFFAQIICLMIFMDFIVVPFHSLFYILGKQKLFMTIQLYRTSSNFLFSYIAFTLTQEPSKTILIFSISDVIFSIITLYITSKLASQTMNVRMKTK